MEPLRPGDPRTVGPWKVLSRIGAGGMGVVYYANRDGQMVALKVVRDLDGTEHNIGRYFERELANLRKVSGPYVAALVDADMEAASAWIAFEYIDGPNLKVFVDSNGPLLEDAWRKFAAALLKGISEVHARGVIHRDLKPSNIVIASTGPKLIDFGIAQALDDTPFTRTGMIVGTPTWMAPEQIDAMVVGKPADLFAAGSILLYAATGREPWGTGTTKEMQARICRGQPDMGGLSAMQSRLISALLIKDPIKRATAEDAVRVLGGAIYWSGVPWRTVFYWTSAALVLVVGLLYGYVFSSPISAAPVVVPTVTAAVVPTVTAAVVPTTIRVVVPTVVPAVPKVWREKRTLFGHTDNVHSIAFSSDGRRLATASRDRTVKLYVAGVAELSTLVEEQAALWCVAFSPDDSVLAVGSEDGSVKLIDSASGRELHTLIGHSGPVYSVAFSLDGKSLATGSKDSTVKLWDTVKGIELKTLDGHSDAVYSLAFSPDGTMLASGSADRSVGVWYLLVDFERRSMWGHAGIVYSVAFSPDSGMLASGARDNTISLQPLTDKSNPLSLTGHTDFVRSVAYSPDGTLVASGSGDNSVILWDAVTGGIVQILTGHARMVRSVAFSPDGRMLASASEDRTIILWEQIPSLGRGASVTPAGSGINASAQAVTLPPSPGFSQVRYTSSRQIWHLPQQ